MLCRVADGSEAGVLCGALAVDANCLALLNLAAGGTERRGRGVLRGIAGLELLAARPADDWPVTRMGGEQSNTSVSFSDQYILKLFRRVVHGPQPDCEVTRYLTEQRQFAGVPAFAGSIDYLDTAASPATIAMVQRLAAHQGDGWRWMQEELGRYQERALTLPASEAAGPNDPRAWIAIGEAGLSTSVEELLGVSDDAAAALGRRTGELHLALGRPTDDQAFSPEPLTATDIAQLVDECRRSAGTAFELLRNAMPRLSEDLVEPASRALSLRSPVQAALSRLRGLGPKCLKTRIHGDYHLGQVLRTGSEFMIIDFEGEPTRPLAARREKHSPLRDVAGMLRSFSYAAQIALINHLTRRPTDLDRLLPWTLVWERSVSGMFLGAYLRTVADSGLVPEDRDSLVALLEVYLLDKVFYELRYELDNRPAWLRVPLAGLLALNLDQPPRG